MPVHYLETGSVDPCYNLALEQYVLGHRTEGDWLLLWQNANTVVIGLNQNTAEEIDAAFVQEHGITAEGYMLSAISDARYLGYDCDEFAEIEKAVGVDSGEGGGSGGGDAKKSAFFNRG